jgi:hypothetical protein
MEASLTRKAKFLSLNAHFVQRSGKQIQKYVFHVCNPMDTPLKVLAESVTQKISEVCRGEVI